jgi:hypothetical protein
MDPYYDDYLSQSDDPANRFGPGLGCDSYESCGRGYGPYGGSSASFPDFLSSGPSLLGGAKKKKGSKKSKKKSKSSKSLPRCRKYQKSKRKGRRVCQR